MVGRNFSELPATAGNTFAITGDVLDSARAFGVQSSSLPDPTVINAEGGEAFIDAFNGGSITILGDALVTADAFGGLEDVDADFGSATGGRALVGSTGGTLDIAGNVNVSANAIGLDGGFGETGAEMRAGLAQVFAAQAGAVTLGGNVTITADAFGPTSVASSGVSASDVFGGQALLNILASGGAITIDGATIVNANANAAFSSNALGGATATGGEATVAVEGQNTLTLQNALTLGANAVGGSDNAGVGGAGNGGTARAFVTDGGTLLVAGAFSANANATGGDGTDGGTGTGGFAGARAIVGQISLLSSAFASALGGGGAGVFGQGSLGGNGLGGTALFQAEGTLTQTAELQIGLDATVFASGSGGKGGAAVSGQAPGGQGGNGVGGDPNLANVAQPDFTNGAYLLAGADNATLTVGGAAFVDASGNGGEGGDGIPNDQPGGQGGTGVGGGAFAGLSLFTGLDGSVGAGVAQFGNMVLGASGTGGFGGFDGQSSSPIGPGGDAVGGQATLLITAGALTAGEVSVTANASGGSGTTGGQADGGAASVEGSLQGTGTLARLFVSASGFGSGGFGGLGGAGTGGLASLSASGIDLTIAGDVLLDSTGFGGGSDGGDGADGTGGTSTLGIITATQGSLQIDGNVSVIANASGGGVSTPGFTGGTGTGGNAIGVVQSGGTVQLGSAQFTATGAGGGSFSAAGGNGVGGTASITASDANSVFTILNDVPDLNADTFNQGAILAANGIGANTIASGFNGGNGTGGTVSIRALAGGEVVLPAAPSASSQLGALRIIALGTGGATLDGGRGGTGNGGLGEIIADGGSVSMGRTEFSVAATGGTGNAGNTNDDADGGSAFGGSRTIEVSAGGGLNAELPLGGTGAVGGNGEGDGRGGLAAAGNNTVNVSDATLNIFGSLAITSNATGGNGADGGTGTDGEARFDASNAVVTFTPDANGESVFIVDATNQGGEGVDQGGIAQGGVVGVSILDSTFAGATIQVSADALGGAGDSDSGVGGDATAGSAAFSTNPSAIAALGSILVSADATGGGADVGGNAVSGDVLVDFSGSDVTITPVGADPATLTVRSEALAGRGLTVGDATAGSATLNLLDSTLIAEEANVSSYADASNPAPNSVGGTATAGLADVLLDGISVLDLELLTIRADAVTSDQGSSFAGGSSVFVGGGGTLTGGSSLIVSDLQLSADATGSINLDNFAGAFAIEVDFTGLIEADLVSATAQGDRLSTTFDIASILLNGGEFLIAGQGDFDAVPDLDIDISDGGQLGDPNAFLSFVSSGLIDMDGDGLGLGIDGSSVFLGSSDIEIGSGVFITAQDVFAISFNTNDPAQIGGVANGLGYSLTQDELAQIFAFSFTFEGPDIVSFSGPDGPDIVLLDAALGGSFEDVSIFAQEAGSVIRVEGDFGFGNGVEGAIRLFADERIEIVTPGSIQILDDTNNPIGTIGLDAANIWIADAATIAQLQADPNFTGRNDQLAVAVSGSDDPLGYLRANNIMIGVSQTLLVRNTGTAEAPGGITIGDQGENGLSIDRSSDPQVIQELDVFAYGRQQLANGGATIGEPFFNTVGFNIFTTGPQLYTDTSEFNDCVINTGVCGTPPPPPPPVF